MKFSALCRFTPMQWQATELADAHRYFLYGGRRGVLKSYWLRWYLLRRLLMWGACGHRNVKAMLATEDYPTLIDRQISKINSEFPRNFGELKKTQLDGLCFHLRPEFGGGKLAFRTLDDPQKYRGAEYAAIGIDELTRNKEFVETDIRLFDVLRGSLRWPAISDCFFAATSNPDGPGQVWVRTLFVEKNLPQAMEQERNHICYLQGQVEQTNLLPQSYWDMLNSLSERLRKAWVEGDWYVNFDGQMFKREWFQIVSAVPADIIRLVRYWDKAGTEGAGAFTAGVLMARSQTGMFFVVDVVRGQWSAGAREDIIKQTAEIDRQRWGYRCQVIHEQEPGSGGKESAEFTTRNLSGFNVSADKVTGDKNFRLEPLAAQSEAGNVRLIAGKWNAHFIDEICSLPHASYRDQSDAAGGAFNKLSAPVGGFHL